MQNLVTAETALKLKNAGFPQPVPEFLQVWYSDEPPYRERIVLSNNKEAMEVVCLAGERITYRYLDQLYAFAPTATDILRELGSDYALSFLHGRFWCERRQFGIVYDHENPAEAAASAWLAKE